MRPILALLLTLAACAHAPPPRPIEPCIADEIPPLVKYEALSETRVVRVAVDGEEVSAISSLYSADSVVRHMRWVQLVEAAARRARAECVRR